MEFLKKNKNSRIEYLSEYIVFDTETSHNHNDEYPSCWVYECAMMFNNKYYHYRYVSDLIDKMCELAELYECNNEKRLVCYAHNLSYDFSYMLEYLTSKIGNPTNVLAYSNHKVFNVVYSNGLEFRCSYRLSNKSLDKWSKDLNTKHRKQIGLVNYDIIRHSCDELTDEDERYMSHDIIVLHECIERQFELYNDNVASTPLTSTGYVRRTIRDNFRINYAKNKQTIDRSNLSVETYQLCKRAFSGGYTHANRYIIEETIRGKIKHYDFKSMYPSELICRKFPINNFSLYKTNCEIRDLIDIANDNAILCVIVFDGVKLKKTCLTPYIQISKLKPFKNSRYKDDNGRLTSYKGMFEYVCDIRELALILTQYKVDKYIITKAYTSRLEFIPDYLRFTINHYFKTKSDFKNILKTIDKNDYNAFVNASLDLMKSKNGLNAIYGCCATDIIRETFSIIDNEYFSNVNEINLEEELSKHNLSKNNVLPYQIGVYTTIYARLRLFEMLSIVGDNFLYCDTDSIFFIDNDDTIENKINEKNREWLEFTNENEMFVVLDNGKKENYLSFENENENIIEFRTLHSKCYCYKTDDNELHLTVAGVSREIVDEVDENGTVKYFRSIDELKSIDNLTNNFIFIRCGGTKAKYINEKPYKNEHGDLCCGGCIITRTSKTLSSDGYENYIYEIGGYEEC